MNRKVGRRHVSIAVMATSLAIASACSSQAGSKSSAPGASGGPSTSASTAPSGAPAPVKLAGHLGVSDGHADIIVGGTDIRFATTVTDASWSPDGSRIAYVDSHGNIATARPDGSGVRVLTKADATVKRVQPTWSSGADITFSERAKDGVWRLKMVLASTTALGDPTYPEGDFDLGGGGSDDTSHDRASTSAFIRPDGANDGVNLIAYEHDGAKGAQVWIIDGNQRSPESKLLIAGADPALSADGSSLAYVGTNGQLYVTPVAKASKSSSRQITFGIKGITRPAWSPDGTRVAFATPSDVESVSAKLAAGVTTNPVTVESPKPGVPAYVPLAPRRGDPIYRRRSDRRLDRRVEASVERPQHQGQFSVAGRSDRPVRGDAGQHGGPVRARQHRRGHGQRSGAVHRRQDPRPDDGRGDQAGARQGGFARPEALGAPVRRRRCHLRPGSQGGQGTRLFGVADQGSRHRRGPARPT